MRKPLFVMLVPVVIAGAVMLNAAMREGGHLIETVIPIAATPVDHDLLKLSVSRSDDDEPTQYLSLDGICRKWRGVFQVSFCMPINTGAGTAESLIASLDAAFAQSFVYSTLRIYLLAPMSAAPSISEPDRFVIPVSAPYQVDTVA